MLSLLEIKTILFVEFTVLYLYTQNKTKTNISFTYCTHIDFTSELEL